MDKDPFNKILANFPTSKENLLSNVSSVLKSDEILHRIYDKIAKIKESPTPAKRCLPFLDIMLEFLHDCLHTGDWHAVDVKLRKSFSVASYFKVIILLSQTQTEETLNECAYIMDLAIMLGDRLLKEDKSEILQETAAMIVKSFPGKIQTNVAQMETSNKRMKTEEKEEEVKCDIECQDRPSLESFL